MSGRYPRLACPRLAYPRLVYPRLAYPRLRLARPGESGKKKKGRGSMEVLSPFIALFLPSLPSLDATKTEGHIIALF